MGIVGREPSDERRQRAVDWPRAGVADGRPWLVFILALAALVPTVGDFGLTWDEPAYRYSQVMSAQWWEQLAQVRSSDELETLFDPVTLLYYWPYGRYGVNFHPPLAGQLNLATYAIFGTLDRKTSRRGGWRP